MSFAISGLALAKSQATLHNIAGPTYNVASWIYVTDAPVSVYDVYGGAATLVACCDSEVTRERVITVLQPCLVQKPSSRAGDRHVAIRQALLQHNCFKPELSDLLLLKRKERGVSVRELAKTIGVTINIYRQLENGQHGLLNAVRKGKEATDALTRLSEVLEIPESKMFKSVV